MAMTDDENSLVLFVAKGTEAIRLADDMRLAGDAREVSVTAETQRHRDARSGINGAYAMRLRNLVDEYERRTALLDFGTVLTETDDDD